jgi:hypothetical protein
MENICIQTGLPCGFPCYHKCPIYEKKETHLEIFARKVKEHPLGCKDGMSTEKVVKCLTESALEAMKEVSVTEVKTNKSK